jgi:hypothetical protein
MSFDLKVLHHRSEIKSPDLLGIEGCDADDESAEC